MSGARDQVTRLLALAPYLQARGGVPLSEVAADFGVEGQAQNFTRESLLGHFTQGGGPVVFSGPGWAQATSAPFSHIYTATGADERGVSIVDSAGSNLTRLSWDQWQIATGGPANGAGLALVPDVLVVPHWSGARADWLRAVDAGVPADTVVLGIPEESAVLVREGRLEALRTPSRLVRQDRDLPVGRTATLEEIRA